MGASLCRRMIGPGGTPSSAYAGNHLTTPTPPRFARTRAYAVHLLTASGVIACFQAVAELTRPTPDARMVFVWLAAAVLIDAIDGPFARAWQVKVYAPTISGRTIDDLVDFLSFTFVPLLLVWRMGWVPFAPGLWGIVWVAPALLASLFGFANDSAKDEGGGFFRGFPSYWNLAAYYAGLLAVGGGAAGRWANAVGLLVLAALTVAPVWFLYPNLAPRPWRTPVLIGAYVWATALLAMLRVYPAVPAWLTLLTLVYPAFYVALSAYLRRARRG